MKWIRDRRPSPAMIVALVALFVSLSGVSYGVATGFIDSRELKNNEVRSVDVRNNTLRTRDLRNNEVRGIDLRNSTVRGIDVGLNALGGDDINESSLGKVPTAANADTANNAANATAVSTLRIIQRTSVAQGAADATLVTHGPLTLSGECSASMGGNTAARVQVRTTEANSAAGSRDFPWPDLDPGASENLVVADDAAAGDPSVASSEVFASAPSGRGLTGVIAAYADADTDTCVFHGHVALQG